jgi:small subunit ribosomal protein S13
MARIAGVNIPNHQHADVALTAIYGIGRARARAICVAAGVDGMKKVKDLSDAQMDKAARAGRPLRSRATCAAK